MKRGSPTCCSNSSMRFTKLKTVCLIWASLGIYYLLSLVTPRSIINGELGVFPNSEGERNDDDFENAFILGPKIEFTPRIVWLMSFPNSGTSFTMSLVGRASNRSFATNYADEVTPRDLLSGSLSIYPQRFEGPFWPGMSGKILSPRPLPDNFILTKTHCGSRCMHCGPSVYATTARDFLSSCSSGHARVPHRKGAIDVQYPQERVAKAIHLIRNPFTNIVSRYHQKRKNQEDKHETEWLSRHPNNATGFQLWCKELDNRYYQDDVEYFGEGNIPQAPCHGEFYKYAQWHNLVEDALEMISHPVPVLTLYYEDYETALEQTASTLLDFLELDSVGNVKEFKPKADVSDYFTKEQKEEVKSLIYTVAGRRTWSQIERYF